MEASQTYILIAIVVLAIVGLLVFFVNKNKKVKKPSPLTSIAIAFILGGTLLSNSRTVGYTL